MLGFVLPENDVREIVRSREAARLRRKLSNGAHSNEKMRNKQKRAPFRY